MDKDDSSYDVKGGGRRGKVVVLIVANDQSLLDIGSVNIAHDRHRQHISATVMML